MSNEYFNMKNPPQNAEEIFKAAVYEQQKSMGRINSQGKPQTLVTCFEDVDPSVSRLMLYLYDNAEVTIDKCGVRNCKSPNITQLKTDVMWMIDQGIAKAVIYEDKQYVFLTPKGEKLLDEHFETN